VAKGNWGDAEPQTWEAESQIHSDNSRLLLGLLQTRAMEFLSPVDWRQHGFPKPRFPPLIVDDS
jgi:hypothetical protein